MRELVLSSPNSFSLIDETSGIDLIFSHPDECIAPERKKKMVSLRKNLILFFSSLVDILRFQRANCE